MKQKWLVPGLAALLLLCTSCRLAPVELPGPEEEAEGQQANVGAPPVLSMPEAAPAAGQTDEPAPPPVPEEEDNGPKLLTAFQSAPGLAAEALPDSYNGLELPIQGATGYASVYLPMWREPEDYEAAQQAIEAWKKREEERRKRAAEEELRRQTEAAVQQIFAQPSANSAYKAPAAQATGETSPPDGHPGDAADPEHAAPGAAEAPPADSGTAPETAPPPEPAPEEPDDPQPSATAGVLAILPAGTDFTVLEENGKWWKVQCTADYQQDGQALHGEIVGWVEHRYCMVNLPDVIPSMI